MSGAAPDDGPPDDEGEARKGVGAHLSWMVLGAILLAVLAVAYHLHGFWWQT